MAKKLLRRMLWLGRGTATMIGVTILLAVVLGVTTTALAAVPGDPLRLGELNTIDTLTRLKGTVSSAMLRIDNDSTDASATALELRVEPGNAPMEVDSGVKVANLNADEVDGASTDEIGVNGWERVEATSALDSRSPKSATARCPSGKVVVGTGADIYGGKEDFDQEDRITEVVFDEIIPSESRLSVIVEAYETDAVDLNWRVTAYAICATAP